MSGATSTGRFGAAWAALATRIDALPDRERHVLLLGAVAVLVAADLMWVQPMGVKRPQVCGNRNPTRRGHCQGMGRSGVIWILWRAASGDARDSKCDRNPARQPAWP